MAGTNVRMKVSSLGHASLQGFKACQYGYCMTLLFDSFVPTVCVSEASCAGVRQSWAVSGSERLHKEGARSIVQNIFLDIASSFGRSPVSSVQHLLCLSGICGTVYRRGKFLGRKHSPSYVLEEKSSQDLIVSP